MMKTRCRIGMLFVVLLAGWGWGAPAQQQRPPLPPSPREPETGVPPRGPSLSRKMLKESFEQLQKDVAQLYDLTAELKEETEKTDEDVFSLTVMKKAEAIEKLAEKIKNRMKNL